LLSVYFYFFFSFCFVLCLFFCFFNDTYPALADALPQGETESGLNTSMSSSANEIASLISVSSVMQRLAHEQTRAKSQWANLSETDRMIAMQKIVYLRLKVLSFVQTSSLEVASVLGRLNSGLAELADRRAMISDQRARTLRRNSFINLISGGLTKIGGYSVALTPSTLIPTNVAEIFDGAVQTSLSAFTIRQQREESKLIKAKPKILIAFLSGNNLTEKEFPETVWTFLNHVPDQSKKSKTRREVLIDHWIEIGRLSDGRSRQLAKIKSNSQNVSIGGNFRLDDLDDTVSMTSDLKSVVSNMETSLMELGEAFRNSYKDDPEI
jgi:hypothetical protein